MGLQTTGELAPEAGLQVALPQAAALAGLGSLLCFGLRSTANVLILLASLKCQQLLRGSLLIAMVEAQKGKQKHVLSLRTRLELMHSLPSTSHWPKSHS